MDELTLKELRAKVNQRFDDCQKLADESGCIIQSSTWYDIGIMISCMTKKQCEYALEKDLENYDPAEFDGRLDSVFETVYYSKRFENKRSK